jgi:integrase
MNYSIHFGLVASKDKTQSIRARVNWGGSRIDVRLGLSVEPDKWVRASGRMVANTTSGGTTAYSMNRKLNEIEDSIGELFQLATLQNRVPSADEVRGRIFSLTGKTPMQSRHKASDASEMPDAGTVFPYLAEFVSAQSKQNEWTHTSVQKYMALSEHLRRYDKNLSFAELNAEGIQGFVENLHGEGLRNTTIANVLGYMRTFLRWCHQRGYTSNTDYDTYRPRLRGSDGSLKEVIYLEWDELMNLYEFQFTDNHKGLEAVRDVFCFQCFTGLRYSDVAKLRKDDINIAGGFFSTVTKKTLDPLRIELNDYSSAILAKYHDKPIAGDHALPVISNVNMNSYLKTIGKMAGLETPCRVVYYKGSRRYEEVHPKWELLTTHCGRRTFVVNALTLGIPAEVIMKWTGHKDYKAMRPYVKIVDSLRASEMEKFNRRQENVKVCDPKTDPKTGK